MIRVKLSKAHLHSFSKSVWYVYVSYWKPSRSSYLSSKGVDVYLTQFLEAPGVQLCLKPGGLYFQCMLLVCFLCSEFSRLIISAACFFFFPSVCLPQSSWKDQNYAGTLLGGLFTKNMYLLQLANPIIEIITRCLWNTLEML